jgi:prolyl-tRNA editing enzyme YbaK/EbsC (Cys-tRNA(Pro) deacylase)
VDESLAADEMILNAGTHRDAIRIRYADFASLVKPNVCSFAKKG